MGLNSCICMRNLNELSAETALNGDGEIEGFNFPNTNNLNVASTDYSSKLKGAGRMSLLMKVNTIDSGILKSPAFYNLKSIPAAEKIQSIFRGSIFRKKFYKNRENFNKTNVENNKIIDENIIEEKKQKNSIKNEEIVVKENENNEIEKKLSVKNNKLEKENNEIKNSSSESEGKILNNEQINNEKIIINNIENNEKLIKEKNINDNDSESSENSNNINNSKKNKIRIKNESKLKEKINDSTKLNYNEKMSNNSSEEKSENDENSINKKIKENKNNLNLSDEKKSEDSEKSNESRKKEIKEEIINTDIKPENTEQKNDDDILNFIPKKTKYAENNFENDIDYGEDWKKYIEEDADSDDSEPSFFQAKLNDEIKNNPNMISTVPPGKFININGEKCLFIGQYEYSNSLNFNLKGKGSLYYKNGVKYEGIFLKGKLNGIGRYITEEGICYEKAKVSK